MKVKLQSLYESIAERIILMALESVDYSEDKAVQILNIVVADTQKEEEEAVANATSDGKVNEAGDDSKKQLELNG